MMMRTIDYFIENIRQERQIERNINQEAFIESFYNKYPELKKMDTEIVAQRTNKLTAILDGNFEAQHSADLIKIRIEESKREFLIKNNIAPNYEEEKPICDKCNDIGYISDGENRKVCKCMEKALDLCFVEAGMGNFTRINSKNLSADYCKNSKRRMEVINKIGKIYKHKVDNRNNIWLYSDGIQTGKTYICVVIAKQIINKGDSAAYFKFEDISELTDRKVELVKGADVLFIDDFSAALTTSGANGSLLNNILETRSGLDLPTILITNETMNELLAESDVRIAGKLKFSERV